MQVHFGTELLHPEWSRSVACVGTFDGVHLGHREVISKAVALGREHEAPCCLVTFDRHPSAVLAPERKPAPIASIAQNLREFDKLGVAVALVLPFTYELSQTPAQTFFDLVLHEKLNAVEIVVGHDFAFGKGREGTPEWLATRAPTQVTPPFEVDGHRVSSSAIRLAIGNGDVAAANRLLGRAWSMTGVVVPGQKLGRELGFPTINLARSFDQILPKDGIYDGECDTPFGRFRAAISVGMRPTVAGTHRTIEAYLLDYPGESLYGAAVELGFLGRLRDEERFDSLEALKNQMTLDIERVRAR